MTARRIQRLLGPAELGTAPVPRGWRVAGPRAHYFEGARSLCKRVSAATAGQHWAVHSHGGVVGLCPQCRRLLEQPREPSPPGV